MSIYPNGIDGEIQLPITVDTVTALNGSLVNSLRAAIISAETELGIMPSAAFATVRERLDAIQGQIDVLIAGGTGAGALPALTGNQYDVLMESPVGVASWNCLRPGLLCPDFGINSLSELTYATLVEVGQTVANPSFSAIYSLPPTTATLIDSVANPTLTIATPTSFIYPFAYVFNTYGAQVSWTLSAGDGVQTDVLSTSKIWTQKIHYGSAAAGQTGGAFIQTLIGTLATTKARTFTVTATASQKIYYAYRTGYGTAAFSVGGFSGGFTLVSTTIPVTNSFGFIENYTLYESDNLGLGTTTVSVV